MAIFLPPWLLQRGFIITKTIQTIMLRTFNLFMPGKWVLWEGSLPSSPSPSLLFLFSPHSRMPRRSVLCMSLLFSSIYHASFFLFLHFKYETSEKMKFQSISHFSLSFHLLSCPLKTKTSYIISKGFMFQNEKTDGCWRRYLLPFPVPEAITPMFVSEVILWADQGKNPVKTAWNGKDVIV